MRIRGRCFCYRRPIGRCRRLVGLDGSDHDADVLAPAVVDTLKDMERSSTSSTAIGELPEMSDEERAARIDALWQRLNDPDGLDWDTLENIERLTEPSR
jgi:hypothetical protein